MRTRLYRGRLKDLVKEEVIYNIVMIGYLDFKYKPFTIKIANINAIKYREIDIMPKTRYKKNITSCIDMSYDDMMTGRGTAIIRMI